jgi:hypothetical protein
MSVRGVMKRRGVEQVLHFTTNRGVLGVLATGALKSRQRLSKDKQLEFILKMNAAVRKDAAWLDYVNLSISRINGTFFDISSEKWHKGQDLWWAVLDFAPEILCHDGVYFTTTNNIYTGVKRGMGEAGIEAMFQQKITQWTGNDVIRAQGMPDSETTCQQAEVLYPKELGVQYLRCIYVRTTEEEDELSGQLALTGKNEIQIAVKPEIFR